VLLPMRGRCLTKILPNPDEWTGINEEAAHHGGQTEIGRSGSRTVSRRRKNREVADS